MPTDAPSEPDIAALSFEQALAQLEAIVAKLESGQAELETSITLYERGARLKAHCETRLRAAQLKVEKITLGADGKPTGAAPGAVTGGGRPCERDLGCCAHATHDSGRARHARLQRPRRERRAGDGAHVSLHQLAQNLAPA